MKRTTKGTKGRSVVLRRSAGVDRKPLLVWLAADERARLTKVAAKQGISRAALIRRALEKV